MTFLENLHITNINDLNPSIEIRSAKIKSGLSVKKWTSDNYIGCKDP